MASREPPPWEKELDDFVRAFSGAFLFGIPLLFTMEMWWLGTHVELWRALALLAIALGANWGLSVVAGFKRESSFGASLGQGVDAVAVGIVASLVVLLVLNRVNGDDPLGSILGKIVVQTIPLSIGASVANAVFSGDKGREGEENGSKQEGWKPTLNAIGATAIGGTFIAFSIAPTEEVPMLASGLSLAHQLALVGVSLLITYGIVFESGFDPQQRSKHAPFQSPVTETTLAYVVSLSIAAVAILLFNPPDSQAPLRHVLAQVLVLGLPAAIGGAAGRLVV